jgi:nitrogen fixation protein FixH
VSGVQVTLEISVPRTRDNTFLVTVRDASGRPIAPQLVRLRFGMLEMDMGDDQADAVVVSPGQYRATGWLAMVGTWRIKVSVRRLDAEDVEAVFDVPVRQ